MIQFSLVQMRKYLYKTFLQMYEKLKPLLKVRILNHRLSPQRQTIQKWEMCNFKLMICLSLYVKRRRKLNKIFRILFCKSFDSIFTLKQRLRLMFQKKARRELSFFYLVVWIFENEIFVSINIDATLPCARVSLFVTML